MYGSSLFVTENYDGYHKIIAEIETLRTDGITYKKINRKEYAYYQWRENGKQRTRRTKDEELERFVKPVAKWEKRECYERLHDYVYELVSLPSEMIFIYGRY